MDGVDALEGGTIPGKGAAGTSAALFGSGAA
jgi:hypothetical protein